MQRTVIAPFLLVSALFWAALPLGTYAQNDTSKPNVGTAKIYADKTISTPTLVHLVGHASVTSENYDLLAADIKAYLPSGSRAGAGVKEAVAEGKPGLQVIAHIRQPLQSASYTINSDRAVYQPDMSRPSGGSLKFTGHVKVITKLGFLAEPSVSTTDTATILLGVGADYPQLVTGPTYITLTPAQ